MSGHGHGHGHPTSRDREPLERGAGTGMILFLDAPSGLSGDMLAGGLVDLGVPLEILRRAVDSLGIEGWALDHQPVVRSGIVATQLVVKVSPDHPQRSWAAIRAILEGAELSLRTRELALAAFRRLAEAEADVHGVPADEVHFHEVGAVDSIVDIVAVSAALDHLGARVVCSPLPLGRGIVTAQHGPLPLPAPATVSCLRGIPTRDGGVDAELVTPTGAALVAVAAREFAEWPTMRPERVGWGAGSRELADRPNLLRLVLGMPGTGLGEMRRGTETETCAFVVLEANVDDLTGELAANALERVLAAGALDAWAVPIHMKKGRPALMLCALARRAAAEELARVLLAESSSLGVRIRPTERLERPRRSVRVETPFGAVGVKIAEGDGLPPNVAPEFEDCRAAADAHGVTVKEVYAAALAAAASLRTSGGGSQLNG